MSRDGHFYLCLHGHFYQPPRENPWIEEIERQESAAPFPDWNERIHYECYLPNTKARVLDEKGLIVDIVNNFEKISFNIGPTLLAWIAAKHPETYERILDADRISRRLHGGHGNAIAQVYNHMIMPLANRRDKITQVRWGIRDFRRRFGREPESLWLPETACNEETLEVVCEFGLRYLILEPNQAEAFRPLGGGAWHDVSSGGIDPKRPYRCFLKKTPARFIDIFFYDGPISRAMGFGDLLFDSKRFLQRIESAKVESPEEDQLIHMATDGETHGHHKPFADRVLAYAMNVEALRRGFKVVNYGEYLQTHPPRFEVRLKEGENGEGTSWSCAHGVKRWKEHCGCRGGGPLEWTQHWRKSLRETFDWLREQLAARYEERASVFLRDVWEARNDYIDVVLERSEETLSPFLARHARHSLGGRERSLCLKLLEMQRFAMLMYTSCGWFFTDLSGIETLQVIEYAVRAAELARDTAPPGTPDMLFEELVERLGQVRGNSSELRDGRAIYEKQIKPRMLSVSQAAAAYAIQALVDDSLEPREDCELYGMRIRMLAYRKEAFGDLTLSLGRMRMISRATLEENELVFVAVHIGIYDFRCSLKAAGASGEFEEMERIFFEKLYGLQIMELLRKIDALFGEYYYALKDLPLRERVGVISILTRGIIEKISAAQEQLYDENRQMSEIYRSLNLPIPDQIRYAVEHTLTRRLKATLLEMARSRFDPKKAKALSRVLEDARALGVSVKKQEMAAVLALELERRTVRFAAEGSVEKETLAECMQIFKTGKKMQVEFEIRRSQEHLFFLLRLWALDPRKIPAGARALHREIEELLAELGLHAGLLKKVLA